MSNDQHTRKFYQKSFSNFFYGVVGVQYAVSRIMGGCPRANQYAVSWHMLENFAGPIIIFNLMTCRLKNTSIRCYSTDSQFFEGTLPTARFDDYLMVAKYFTFSNVKSYVQSLPKLVSFVIFILKRSVKKVWALSTKRIIRGPPPPLPHHFCKKYLYEGIDLETWNLDVSHFSNISLFRQFFKNNLM